MAVKKQVNIYDVIDKFFDDKKIGTRDDLMSYINEQCRESEIIDDKNKVIDSIHRTNLYKLLSNIYTKTPVDDDFSKGRPSTYWFREKDKELVKDIVIQKSKTKLELLKSVIEFAASHNYMFTKSELKTNLGIDQNKCKSILSALKKYNLVEQISKTGLNRLKVMDYSRIIDILYKNFF